MFGYHGKHYFPENDFRLTTNFIFDPEMNFSPHFHFNLLPEKEREREREREREERAQIRERERGREKREPRSCHSFDDRTAPTSGAIDDRDGRDGAA